MQGLRNEAKILGTLRFFTRNNSTATKKNLYDVLLLTPKATSVSLHPLTATSEYINSNFRLKLKRNTTNYQNCIIQM